MMGGGVSSWSDNALQSAVVNFFYAILDDKLELLINDEICVVPEEIKKGGKLWSKIPEKVQRYIEVSAAEPVGKHYIKGIGKILLHLKINENEEGAGQKLAFVRFPGLMLTDSRTKLGDDAKPSIPKHWLSFTAVVACFPQDGDWVLRACERPSHDELSVDMIKQTDTERRKEAKKALRALADWLREEIGKRANPQLSEVGSYANELEDLLAIEQENGSNQQIKMSPLTIRNRAPRMARLFSEEESLKQEDFEFPNGEGDIEVPLGGEGSGGDRPGSKTTTKDVTLSKADARNLSPKFFKPTEEAETHKLIVSILPEKIKGKQVDLVLGVGRVGEDESTGLIGLKSVNLNEQKLKVERGVFTIPAGSLPDSEERIELELDTNEPIHTGSFRLLRVIKKEEKK